MKPGFFPNQENRCKLLVVDKQHILTVLNFHRSPGMFLGLPIGNELPADTFVEDVCFDISRRGLLLRIWSSDFEVVPDGEEAPILYPMFEITSMHEYRLVKVDKPEDSKPANDDMKYFFFNHE